jgi:cell division protein FtsW
MSASEPLSLEKFGESYGFLRHQVIVGALPGIAALLVGLAVPSRWWFRMAPAIFVASIALLVAVLIPGVYGNFGTAKSWISVGPFSFQPGELMKGAIVLAGAVWFARRSEDAMVSVEQTLFPFILWLGLVGGLFALQPDIGGFAIVAAIAGLLYLAAGAPWKHLAILLGGGMLLFALLIRVAPYRAERFMTFLHPELDPQGIGYHINQAFLAVGSGGFLGLGFGHSRQKFEYLPEVVGDSIFAVFAEEMGFVGGVMLLGLLWYFVHVILREGKRLDRRGALLMVGFAGWVGVQTAVNVGAMLGLAPLTGVPLPFISYGGTALVVLLGMTGLITRTIADQR